MAPFVVAVQVRKSKTSFELPSPSRHFDIQKRASKIAGKLQIKFLSIKNQYTML